MSAPQPPPLPSERAPSVVRYLLGLPGRRLIHIDAAASEVTGLGLAHLREAFEAWIEAIHRDDRGGLRSVLEEARPGRHELEYRIVRTDGTVRWMVDSVYVWQDRRGEVTVGGRAVDVTRERELQERLLLQSQLLGAVGQAVFAVDDSGLVTYWNRMAERIFARTAREAVHRPLEAVVPLAASGVAGGDVLATVGRVGSWEGELVLPDRGEAEDIRLRLRLTKLTGRDGRPIGAVGIAADVTADWIAAEALERSREELRQLTGHTHSVREQEQGRMAREIHDVLGQMLTALKLDVGWLERRVRGHGSDAQPLASRLERMGLLVEQILDTTRHLTQQLRPVALDDLGLEAAVEGLLLEVGSRADLETSLDCRLDGMPDDPARETASYRIVQEALTNVVRHAGAARVEVALLYRDGGLELRVSDDGNGQPARGGGLSMGRLGMQERALVLGGKVQWAPRPEGGTMVTAWLPDRDLPPEERAGASRRAGVSP